MKTDSSVTVGEAATAQPAPAAVKICRKCNQSLPMSEFRAYARYADGLVNWCRACSNAYQRERAEKDREKERARCREYGKRNAEARKACAKAYYKKNAESLRAKSAAYREANRERLREHYKQYQKAHPEIGRQVTAKRRALKRDTQIEPVDYRKILERDGYHCHICNSPVAEGEVSFDHVIPLSKGGPHSYDNIKVAHLLCNNKKQNKILTTTNEEGSEE